MRLTAIALLALVGTVTTAQAANVTHAPRYHVLFKIADGDRVLDTPSIVVNAGSISSVSSAAHHYNIAVTAVPSWSHPANRIALSTNVLVDGGTALAPKYRRLATTVDVAANEPVRFVVPADAASKGKSLAVEFTVIPVTDAN